MKNLVLGLEGGAGVFGKRSVGCALSGLPLMSCIGIRSS